jgi:hypothetical protein
MILIARPPEHNPQEFFGLSKCAKIHLFASKLFSPYGFLSIKNGTRYQKLAILLETPCIPVEIRFLDNPNPL